MATHGQPGSGKAVFNECASIQAWLRSVPKGSTVAMEATGKYHRLVAELAHAAGMRVYVLNARDVYFYAKALSARGKTDRLDADVIARYAAEHHARLHAWQPAAGVEQQLQELLQRRSVLTRQLVTLRQTLRDMPTLQAPWQRLQDEYARTFEEIDRQLADLVDSDLELREGVARLRTITGFGPQASTLLGALLRRLPFRNADALVAYSGLDPGPCDSGTKRGKRRLSKRGPGALRHLMYMVAFAGAHSKALGPLYQAIKARGFAPTQALVILARKLLRVAWAVWRSGQAFDPSRLATPQA